MYKEHVLQIVLKAGLGKVNDQLIQWIAPNTEASKLIVKVARNQVEPSEA